MSIVRAFAFLAIFFSLPAAWCIYPQGIVSPKITWVRGSLLDARKTTVFNTYDVWGLLGLVGAADPGLRSIASFRIVYESIDQRRFPVRLSALVLVPSPNRSTGAIALRPCEYSNPLDVPTEGEESAGFLEALRPAARGQVVVASDALGYGESRGLPPASGQVETLAVNARAPAPVLRSSPSWRRRSLARVPRSSPGSAGGSVSRRLACGSCTRTFAPEIAGWLPPRRSRRPSTRTPSF